MSATKAKDPSNSENDAAPVPDPASRANSLVYYGALAFIAIACIVFVFTAYRLFNSTVKVEHGLGDFYPELLLCATAVFVGLIGVSPLRSVGLATVVPGPVLNRKEWAMLAPQVKDGKEEPVTQYIRLRSLTGFTGTFTMLGLTGLPLATIGLTIFFSLMYLKDPQYLELAKLTLGAFIGSFVQKQVGERQGGGGVVELPTGQKLKVQSSLPPTIA
jgi:hypothetical protein